MEVLEVHKNNFIGALSQDESLNNFSFPSSKDEDYKYTRLAALKNAELHWAESEVTDAMTEEINNFIVAKNLQNVLVFVDGELHQSTADVNVENTEKFDWKNYRFLNQVFAELAFTREEQIYQIDVKKENTLNLVHFVSEPNSIYALSYKLANLEGQDVELNEWHIGPGALKSFININRNFTVAKDSKIDIHSDQLEKEADFYMSHTYASVAEKAQFNFHAINSGYKILRNNIHVDINGQFADANIHQAFLGQDKNLLDNHILVNHYAENTTSNQLVKGVLDGKSRGVFNGKVYVAKDAQKVNAYQTNNNIILDPQAIVDAKPELEIYADDVRCSHGSTTGQINEDALFYLKARGIGKRVAHQLLLQSFIEEVVEEFKNETFIQATKEKLNQFLSYNFE